MSKLILGLVGPLASGKGEIKRYLVQKYQAEDCRFSNILRDVLIRTNIEVSRSNLQKLSTVLRQNFGEDILAKAIANDAKNFKADIIVVDGVRRMADIKYLRNLENFKLISIDAIPQKRYERMLIRNENDGDDRKSFDAFMQDHQAEAELEIPEVIKNADLNIRNDGSLDDLYNQIDQVIAKLK